MGRIAAEILLQQIVGGSREAVDDKLLPMSRAIL